MLGTVWYPQSSVIARDTELFIAMVLEKNGEFPNTHTPSIHITIESRRIDLRSI
jgi:hypothetical protein